MLVPVTPQLADAMERTHLLMAAIDRSAKEINDRDSYSSLAKQLEDLTVNVMTASSSLSLIGVEPRGARFRYSPDMDLPRHVTGCVAYLRITATELLTGDTAFSAYASKHSDEALSRLRSMYRMLIHGIRRQAYEDMKTAGGGSPRAMIAMADYLAEGIDRVQATKS